jgi:hypothetical protein
MDRRQMLAGLAVSAFAGGEARATGAPQTFLEIKTWYLHNSQEGQAARVSDYLEGGLLPALTRAGAKPVGAFANLIGPNGPYFVTVAQFTSLGVMQDVLSKLALDDAHEKAAQRLSAGPGLPFVRVESSLLKSFSSFPEPAIPDDVDKHPARVFELRTYESQSLTSLQRKVTMFNGGEIAIFERLGMRPVFFGETIVGPRQPCLIYMLSFDNLDAREKLWHDFGADPAWKRLSSPAPLKDAEIVVNISNVMLRPLPFSPVR